MVEVKTGPGFGPIVPRKLADLLPYAKNPRTHDADQIELLKRSMQEFGFTDPILVDERGEIIGGHGRLMAAQALGIAEVPTQEALGWSEDKKRAYRILENKAVERGGWHEDFLREEVALLDEAEFDLLLTGFGEEELREILEDEPEEEAEEDEGPEPQTDRAAELLAKWGCKRGDIWEFGALGKHRLMCGDSTSAADVALLMQDRRARLCFTSPPYGQQRDYGAKITDWDALMRGVFQHLQMTPDGQVLVNLGMIHDDGEWLPYWFRWLDEMRALGWRRFGWYVWDQGAGLPGDWNGRLAPSHEFMFHFNRQSQQPRKIMKCKYAGRVLGGTGLRRSDGTLEMKTGDGNPVQDVKIPDSVVRVVRSGRQDVGHPATFPVALASFMLEAWTDSGDLCFEPFAGSGTQFLAAEKLKRICYGCEIEPKYCAVILERMTALGLTPNLV